MKTHEKCPHCGSTNGFKIKINQCGYTEKTMSFFNYVLNSEFIGSDCPDDYAYCLDCKKPIDIDELDISNI